MGNVLKKTKEKIIKRLPEVMFELCTYRCFYFISYTFFYFSFLKSTFIYYFYYLEN